jgi:hypothetical protein
MAVLKQQLEKFDNEFRAKYLLLLEELQAKKPKGVSLEFETDPWDDSNVEQIHYLSSMGVRQIGKRKYGTLRDFVYKSGISLEGLQKTLEGLQSEIGRYSINVDWKKIMNSPKS